jgi:hypothetical protein
LKNPQGNEVSIQQSETTINNLPSRPDRFDAQFLGFTKAVLEFSYRAIHPARISHAKDKNQLGEDIVRIFQTLNEQGE